MAPIPSALYLVVEEGGKTESRQCRSTLGSWPMTLVIHWSKLKHSWGSEDWAPLVAPLPQPLGAVSLSPLMDAIIPTFVCP